MPKAEGKAPVTLKLEASVGIQRHKAEGQADRAPGRFCAGVELQAGLTFSPDAE